MKGPLRWNNFIYVFIHRENVSTKYIRETALYKCPFYNLAGLLRTAGGS